MIDAGITPSGFNSEAANRAHIKQYVQSFEDHYQERLGTGMVNCKTGSSRLLDVGMLHTSEEFILCKACVIKQREKERKADECAMRKILNDITTKKSSNLEVQTKFDKYFINKQKNNGSKTHQFVKKM